MTPVLFRACLGKLQLSVPEFAKIIDLAPVTCYNWGKPRSGRGVQEFPVWVTLLLDAWLAHPDLVPIKEKETKT
jgi:hypothetical protein